METYGAAGRSGQSWGPMTGIDLLIIVAGVQAALLIALVTLIVLTRWMGARRRARAAGPRAGLEQAVAKWLAGRGTAASILWRLRLLPTGLALDALLHFAAHMEAGRWRQLTDLVARERWVGEVRSGARSRYWWRRLDAGRLLAVAPRPQDVPIVLRLLADEHPAVVMSVLPAIERVESPALAAAVLERLPHFSPTVQAYAAEALRRSRARVVPVLAKNVAGPPEREGLAAFVDLAGRIGEASLREAVTALADHEDLEVRVAVAKALGRFPHDASVAALTALARDSQWEVRAQAIQSLSRLKAPATRTFQAGLRDPAWWVRLRSGLALAAAGAEGRNALLAEEVGPDAFARDMARLLLGLPAAALAEYQR